jgi:diguanylate cyclase (GGDEF)-like protein/PAS domain S-box-containing protein
VGAIGAERLQRIIEAQRDIMACGPDIRAVMRVTAERAQQLTRASAGVVELAEGDEMVYRAGSGTATGMEGLRLKLVNSLSGLSVLSRTMLYAEDTDTDPRVDRQACQRVGARSMLVVPLFHQGGCAGVLKVLAPLAHAFDDSDVTVLRLMAGFIASAMGHAAAYDALVASEGRFRALAELALDAIATVDGEGLLKFWNRSAERLFGYSAEQVLNRPLKQLIPEVDAALHELRTHVSPAPGKVLELEARALDGSHIPIELALSICVGRGADQFTLVMRDIRERKRLEAAAIDLLRVDQLTGLLVRRAGSELVKQAAEHARRQSHGFAVVMLDVDHFKDVNDNYGHHVGDEILRRIGAVVRQSLRDSDVAVRWGGEELLLFLRETPLQGALECAERVRAGVADLRVCGVDRVTLSAGVACCSGDEPVEAVIAQADHKLYAAKRGGRDRVSM